VKLTRIQVLAVVVALAAVVAGKHYYRNAGADELRWLLAPTAKMVNALSSTHFVHAPGVGYIDRDVAFEIAPVCAGLHFLLAGFLALVIGWLGGMRTLGGAAKRLALAVVVAYAATLVVNTIRIAIAIRMHAGGELHRVEGVVVYLVGLCALYAAAKKLEARRVAA
jgi:exosortase K